MKSTIHVEEISKQITPILAKHQVGFAGVFGSFARGEADETSDIDLLVRFDKPKSLFQMVAIEQELRGALNRPVDLVTEGALHRLLRPQVFRDLKVIYGKR